MFSVFCLSCFNSDHHTSQLGSGPADFRRYAHIRIIEDMNAEPKPIQPSNTTTILHHMAASSSEHLRKITAIIKNKKPVSKIFLIKSKSIGFSIKLKVPNQSFKKDWPVHRLFSSGLGCASPLTQNVIKPLRS